MTPLRLARDIATGAPIDRKYPAVHKYAEKHGFRFSRRPRREVPWTLAEILALDPPGTTIHDDVAIPDAIDEEKP